MAEWLGSVKGRGAVGGILSGRCMRLKNPGAGGGRGLVRSYGQIGAGRCGWVGFE